MLSCFSAWKTYAQLGLCSGNSGDPIFTETFGTGVGNNVLPPPGTTTYTYTNNYPLDGFYTVANGTFGNAFDWHQIGDHTPNDTNGKCLIVNAATSSGEFYRTVITGLCENTTYGFSSWLINLVKVPGFCVDQGIAIPVNVSFEIWDSTDTNLLVSGTTGDIIETALPNWQEYGLLFQTLAGQTSVILKIINNGQGGCGNDLAIDDIAFKTCGDFVPVRDASNDTTISICSGQTPYTTTLTATPDNSVFSSHFYQWQESTNGFIWSDIPGNGSSLSVSITTSMFYRTKVAEIAVNLGNPKCITFSEPYQAIVSPDQAIPATACWETATLNITTCQWNVTGTQPPAPSGLACWETASFNNITCVWEVTGSQPVQPTITCSETATFNSTTCVWDVTVIQPLAPTGLACWEIATFNNTTCVWEVTGTQPVQPIVTCSETATFNNTTCVWDVAVMQPIAPIDLACWETPTFNTTNCEWEVTGSQPVQPTLGCWETATFNNTTCLWDVFETQSGTIIEVNLVLCDGNELIIQAQTNVLNPSYVWSTGENTEEITVDTPGVYTADITSGACSFETIIYNVMGPNAPIIESVESNGSEISITTANSGDFLYSLDGIIFQSSSIFFDVAGGLYSIYAKDRDCNITVGIQHLHFYIPKFFTPNNDGVNDTFSLSGLENYGTSQVSIFNRYGQLLKFAQNTSFTWDGTYNNQQLPSDEYWYAITIEAQKFTGHFALKR